MEEHLPQLYFDKKFITNLVNLFEEIDVNGDGGMEWEVCIYLKYSEFMFFYLCLCFYYLFIIVKGIYFIYNRINRCSTN